MLTPQETSNNDNFHFKNITQTHQKRLVDVNELINYNNFHHKNQVNYTSDILLMVGLC